MTLEGYKKVVGKLSGGIRAIALVSAADVTGAEYAQGVCTEIKLAEGKAFAGYEFKEGESVYTEEMSVRHGVAKVRHTITFAIERPASASAAAAARLAEASAEGMVAIVTTNSRVSFVVGYSEKFGKEQPLRLTTTALTTGRSTADDTTEILTLVSEDDRKAPVYTGSTAQQ